MSPLLYRRWLLLLIGIVLVIGGIALFSPDTLLLLRSQVPLAVTSLDTYRFSWTPNTPGIYQLNLQATDSDQAQTTDTVTIIVAEPTPSPSASPAPTSSVTPTPTVTPSITPTPSFSPAGGGGGGSSGGGNGGGGPEVTACQPVSRQYQAENGHQVSGSYSGPVTQNGTRVVKLAHGRAVLEKKITVARGDYWLEARLRHDRPGPVYAAVYLNNRPWKVVKLAGNDDQYRTHRLGLLRNFSGATIRFRLLNDAYDRANPSNEATDKNFFIDWWQLTSVCP